MQGEMIYAWEQLDVYRHMNEVSRVLGKLLVSLPSKFHVQVHSLIGYVVAISNAIPGAHRDRGPGDPPISIEERRAWLMIGFVSSGLARSMMLDLGRAANRSRSDFDTGLNLLSRIEADFQKHLETLDGSDQMAPQHFA